jgi:hypothetical protein
MSTYLVNYDHKRLEKLLGGDVSAIDAGQLLTRMTARAITDSVGSKEAPSVKLSNAEWWVKRAYEDGHEAGVLEERKRWQDSICKVFGIKR